MNKFNFVLISASILIVSLLALPTFSMSISHRPNMRIFGTAYSLNWAGFAENSGTYTSASGTWVVPKVTSSGYSSVWIGIDGFNQGSNNVIQIGTEQDCSGSKKTCTANYYAWWELYPDNAEQPIPSCSKTLNSNCISVSPGDSMTAFVSRNSDGSWTLRITDNTKSQSFSTVQTPQTFTPDLSSAELIIERPALCTAFSCTLTNLANFGLEKNQNSNPFDNLAQQTIMVDNGGHLMASPTTSTVGTNGAFNVQWYRSN